MVTMVKKAVRVPSESETVTVDNESVLNLSSRCRPIILKPNKHGEPRSKGKVKNVRSNISPMEKLSSQYHSRKNKCKTVHHQGGSSKPDPSYPDEEMQGNKFNIDFGSRSDQVRSEYGVELSTLVDAALALMELANDSNQLPGSKVLTHQLNDTVPHGNHSQVAGYKAKLFEKFQQSADDIQEEDRGRFHKKKRRILNALSLLKSKYKNDDVGEERNFQETSQIMEGHELITKLQNKGQCVEACLKNPSDRLGTSSLRCERVTKKQKKKADVLYMCELVEYDDSNFKSRKVLNEPPISTLKKGKSNSSHQLIDNSFFQERGAKDKAVPETKQLKKLELPPGSPMIRKGFSFSIIHFLSAIRTAMIMPGAEDDISAFGEHLEKDNSNIAQTEKINLPSLTIHEIVVRVRRNPIDPCILEAREPLEDLVRGALNIFSSKLVPSGVKGWQALTSYLKPTKSWSWIGPVSLKPDKAIKEQVTAEAWGLPRRMLAKLVDSFANWLTSVEDTLQQIKSLPAPPMTTMLKTAHLKDRLRGARPRKCIATISPCSAELRAYFHKEEALRYSVPERAFSYTAVDGRKSTVAPMRRSSGKPSSKVRDHFMLKADRPPHVTVLCLVRDAAARLPESMGTRTDVCTLMRDSQYIVEDVSDEQLNQVVSRGLDRLHYENDPCVQYNGDKKLWVYLHGEREEEDF